MSGGFVDRRERPATDAANAVPDRFTAGPVGVQPVVDQGHRRPSGGGGERHGDPAPGSVWGRHRPIGTDQPGENKFPGPLDWSNQLSLLLFKIIASKGAAGVTGVGLAVLGGDLQAHAPNLVPGVGLIVAVDRFMPEARALTNFSGTAVATLVIAHWVKEIDHDKTNRVFSGEDPFDDADMLEEHGAAQHRADVDSSHRHGEVAAH